MVVTGFKRSMRPFRNQADPAVSRRITSPDWETVGKWTEPVPSKNRFSIGVFAKIDTTDEATTGELRFAAANANGAVFWSESKPVPAKGWHQTKWVQVHPQGAEVIDYTLDVQMRRVTGDGALLDVDVNPIWLSGPADNVQECNPLSVAGSNGDWGDGTGTLANPIQGTGGSLILIGVAPGPAFADLNGGEDGVWVDPPGYTHRELYTVTDPSALFVQRVAFWFFAAEDGAADYTFGFNAPGSWPLSQRRNSRFVMGFDGSAPAMALHGPNMDNTPALMPYPHAPTSEGFLAVAVATDQNDDGITGLPSGGSGGGFAPWTQHFNNTGGGVDRRGLAVFSKAVTDGPNLDPGSQQFGGTTAAHGLWTITLPCGSGGTVSSYVPLDTSQMTFNLDASDPSTYGRERTDKQLINAGPGHNPPPPAGGNNYSSSWGTGYDMTWNAAGTEMSIPGSLVAPNGESRRMWPDTIGGVPVIEALSLWTGNGYGAYQSPWNLDVVWNESDRPYVDGTRLLHYSDSDGSLFRCGPGATEETYIVVFATKEWMIGPNGNTGAMNNCTGPLDFHCHPNLPLPSPFYMNIREGNVEFIHRSKSGGGALDLSTGVTGGDLDLGGPVHTEQLEGLDGFNAFIVQYKIDPTTTDRYLRAYKIDSFGSRSLLFTDTSQRGYYLTGTGTYSGNTLVGSTVSGQYYPIHQYYIYHAYTTPADAAAGVVHNWDANTSRVGPYPTMRTAASARCYRGNAFTLEENTNEIRNVLGLI